MNEKRLAAMARRGLSDRDIADYVGCTVDDLTPYAALLKRHRVIRKARLLRWQLEAAEKHNATVLNHLARTELHQHDNAIHQQPEPSLDAKVG